jgi:phosphate/phosphite/phosphonate ABC transporter binding protein
MQRWLGYALVVCALVASGCSGSPKTAAPPVAPADGPLKFGVMPAVSAAETAEIYKPLVAKMGAAIGRPIEVVVAPSYDALEAQVLAGTVDFAQVSSILYVTAVVKRMEAGKALVLIAQEQSTPERGYRGVFVVKPDSAAGALADLKGKKMAYVAKNSSGGYFFQRMRLRELGLDPDTFFGATEFVGSHDAVVDKVKSGTADVGAVSEIRATLSGLKILDKTAEIPGDTIVAVSDPALALVPSLTPFFTNADKDPGLVNVFIARGLVKYVVAADEAYAPERKELGLK